MVNVQKHKLFLSLLLLTITGIFSACTDDTENLGSHNGTPLDINVGVNTTESRAVITGNSLPDGSQIGVTVVDQSGNGYQDQNYNNVCYQAVTEDGSQKWKVQSRSDILLSGEAGTLYAYYPWSSAVSDIKQIAVNMDETDQKDWMVAQPVTNLSDAQATAAVKMEHMLTNFKLAFYKDNYSGKGEVTAVTIRSNGFATTATLDATTGAFTAYGDAHTLTRPFATTLGTDKAAAAPCNIMVVPNTVAAPVTVSVTVDGKTYSSVTSSLTLAKAKSYNYAMKLSSTGLDITEVTLTDWNTEDLGNTDFKPEGAEQQESYSDYLKLIYNVTDVTEPTEIFYIPAQPISLLSRDVPEFSIDMVDELIVEGESITPTLSYQFSEEGLHTVYVKFKDVTVIPGWSFSYGKSLMKVTVPNTVEVIGGGAFIYSDMLKEINLSASVKEIENSALYDCEVLEKITVEPGNPVFDSRNNCNAIMETATNRLVVGCKNTIIPEDCEIIGEDAFYNCVGLTGELVIPNSVKTIEGLAFGYCTGLESIIIGSGVQTIGYEAFETCNKLKTIISYAMNAPNIDNNTFSNVAKNGVLYVPIGSSGYDTWMSTNNFYLGKSGWTKEEMTE